MICDYIESAMQQAHYELIEDDEPYYGEVHALKGIWASGKTLEECRRNLRETIEGWILVRIARGMEIPPLGQSRIVVPQEISVA